MSTEDKSLATMAAGLASLILLLSAICMGCSALASVPEVRTVLSAARAASLGILELIDFIESNGGSQDKADAAKEALRGKDYGAALAAGYLGVEELRARGVLVPEHIDRSLYMIKGAMAAQAFDDLAKAMRSSLDDPAHASDDQP